MSIFIKRMCFLQSAVPVSDCTTDLSEISLEMPALDEGMIGIVRCRNATKFVS